MKNLNKELNIKKLIIKMIMTGLQKLKSHYLNLILIDKEKRLQLTMMIICTINQKYYLIKLKITKIF